MKKRNKEKLHLGVTIIQVIIVIVCCSGYGRCGGPSGRCCCHGYCG